MSQEKVALITGVSSGIGRAIAGLLARSGFRVFGTTRGIGEPKKGPEEVELVRADVRDGESVRPCVRTVLDRAGRIDALVNNAGYTLISSLEETSIEEAKQLFETNFFGVLRMTQAVLPIMREQRSGRIVNVGSVVGIVPAPYQGIYCASKHAWKVTPNRWITKSGSSESACPQLNRVSRARTLRRTAKLLAARWKFMPTAATASSKRLSRTSLRVELLCEWQKWFWKR